MSIAGSDSSMCALLNDSLVKCWGDGAYGPVGILKNKPILQPESPVITVDGKLLTAVKNLALGSGDIYLPTAGSVGFVQFFGSILAANPHLHMTFLAMVVINCDRKTIVHHPSSMLQRSLVQSYFALVKTETTAARKLNVKSLLRFLSPR